MSEAPISSDPRAVEILAKVLYHDHEALKYVLSCLDDRMLTVLDAVIWLTKPHEHLGYKWPLWCTEAQVLEVLKGERVIG